MRTDLRVICAAILSGFGSFLFGLDIGYIAPIIECASFKRDVVHLENWRDPSSSVNSTTVGWIVGIFSIGCICTSQPSISSYFSDGWGRRASLSIGASVFLIGCVVQAAASTVNQMLAGRFIGGCSIGLLSTVVPLYLAEIAPSDIRGALTCIYELAITFGVMVASLLDFLLVRRDGGWRLAILFQIAPATMLLLGSIILPESPRWLVQQGRKEDALDVLLTIRPDAEARQEVGEVEASWRVAQALGEPSWSEIYSGRVGKLVGVGIVLQLLQQFVGMNAFNYYGPRIFMSVGSSPNAMQAVIQTTHFVATLPALYLADRAGRRSSLIWGACGMLAACLAMGYLGLLTTEPVGETTSSNFVGVATVAASMFFIISFSCSWGPMVWVYCAEMFPLKVRGRCVGVTTTTSWIGNYIVAQLTPILLQGVGFNMFFIFALFCVAAFAMALRLPETKGVPLEDIGQLFDDTWGTKVVDDGPYEAAYGSVT